MIILAIRAHRQPQHSVQCNELDRHSQASSTTTNGSAAAAAAAAAAKPKAIWKDGTYVMNAGYHEPFPYPTLAEVFESEDERPSTPGSYNNQHRKGNGCHAPTAPGK